MDQTSSRSKRLSARVRKPSYKILESRKESEKSLKAKTSLDDRISLEQSNRTRRCQNDTNLLNDSQSREARVTTNNTSHSNSTNFNESNRLGLRVSRRSAGLKRTKSENGQHQQDHRINRSHSKQMLFAECTLYDAGTTGSARLCPGTSKPRETRLNKKLDQSSTLSHTSRKKCISTNTLRLSKTAYVHRPARNPRTRYSRHAKRRKVETNPIHEKQSFDKGNCHLQGNSPIKPSDFPISEIVDDNKCVQVPAACTFKIYEKNEGLLSVNTFVTPSPNSDKKYISGLSTESKELPTCGNNVTNSATINSETQTDNVLFKLNNIKNKTLDTLDSNQIENSAERHLCDNISKDSIHISQLSKKISKIDTKIAQTNGKFTEKKLDDTQKENEMLQDNTNTQTGIHTTQKSNKCTQNDEIFSEDNKKDHMLSVLNTAQPITDPEVEQCRKTQNKQCFQCDECGKILATSSGFAKHLFLHSGRRPYVCEICGLSFMLKDYLRRHMVCHSGQRKFECQVCGKKFTRLSNLAAHKLVHSDEKLFPCAKCSKTFKTTTSRDRHQQYHNDRMYGCAQCGKRFVTKQLLEKHKNLHKDYKPYGCDVCGKAFAYHQSLQEHLMRHSGMKPVPCTLCEKRFNNKRELTAHMRYHEIKTEFSCTRCSLYYESEHSLKKHIAKTHKPVDVCEICQKKFTNKRKYKSHMFHNHRGKNQSPNVVKSSLEQTPKSKKFTCTICNAMFYNKTGLKKHFTSKHGFSQDEMKVELKIREQVRPVRSEPYSQWEEPDEETEGTAHNMDNESNVDAIESNSADDPGLDDKEFKVFYKDEEMSVFVKLGKGQQSKVMEGSRGEEKFYKADAEDQGIRNKGNKDSLGNLASVLDGAVMDERNLEQDGQSKYKVVTGIGSKAICSKDDVNKTSVFPDTKSTFLNSDDRIVNVGSIDPYNKQSVSCSVKSRTILESDITTSAGFLPASTANCSSVSHNVNNSPVKLDQVIISESNYVDIPKGNIGAVDQLGETNDEDDLYVVVSESGDFAPNKLNDDQGHVSLGNNTEIVKLSEDGDHIILIVGKDNDGEGHAISMKDFTGNQTIMINGEQYEIISSEESTNMIEDVVTSDKHMTEDKNYADNLEVNTGNFTVQQHQSQITSVDRYTLGSRDVSERGALEPVNRKGQSMGSNIHGMTSTNRFVPEVNRDVSQTHKQRPIVDVNHSSFESVVRQKQGHYQEFIVDNSHSTQTDKKRESSGSLKQMTQHPQDIRWTTGDSAVIPVKDRKVMGPDYGNYQTVTDVFQVQSMEVDIGDTRGLDTEGGVVSESEMHGEHRKGVSDLVEVKEDMDSNDDVLEELKQFADLVALQEHDLTVGSDTSYLLVEDRKQSTYLSNQNQSEKPDNRSENSENGVCPADGNGHIYPVTAKDSGVPLVFGQETERVNVDDENEINEGPDFRPPILDDIEREADELGAELSTNIKNPKGVMTTVMSENIEDNVNRNIKDLGRMSGKPGVTQSELPVPKSGTAEELHKFEEAIKDKAQEFRSTEDYKAFLDKMMSSLQRAKMEFRKT